MDMNRLTEKVQQALSASQTKALQDSHSQIDVEHLLGALLEQPRGLAVSIFNKAEISLEGIKEQIAKELAF